jgi:predicted Zn-dependent protease
MVDSEHADEDERKATKRITASWLKDSERKQASTVEGQPSKPVGTYGLRADKIVAGTEEVVPLARDLKGLRSAPKAEPTQEERLEKGLVSEETFEQTKTSGGVGAAPQVSEQPPTEVAETAEFAPPKSRVEDLLQMDIVPQPPVKAETETREDIDFEDLGQKESPQETHGQIDIDSILAEDSDAFALGVAHEERPQTTEGAQKTSESKPSGLGLPDEWLSTPVAEEPALQEPEAPAMSVDSSLSLDVPPIPEISLGMGEVEQAIPPPVERPIMPPAPEAVRPRMKRVSTASPIRISLVAVLIFVIVGVILGQTDYGYFGMNLMFPQEKGGMAGVKVAIPKSEVSGIFRDTCEAFISEIERLEKRLGEEPKDTQAKQELCEVLARFRERYPTTFLTNERSLRRLEQLMREIDLPPHLNGMIQAIQLLSSGSLEEAKSILHGLRAGQGDNPDVLYLLGKVALAQKDLDEAQKFFESALLKNPDYLAVRYFLAKTYLEKGDLKSAKAMVQDLLNRESEHHGARTLMAMIAIREKDVENAKKEASLVIEKADRTLWIDEVFDAHKTLAEAYRMAGDEQAFVHELKVALSIKPADEEAATSAAEALLGMRKPEEALSVLEPCWNKKCEGAGFLKVFLKASLFAMDSKKAEEALKIGVDKHPKDAEFYCIYGRYLLDDNMVKAASTYLRKSLEVDDTYADGYVLLSESLRREAKLSEARDALKEGLQKVKERSRLLLALAETYREMRDYQGAEDALREILSKEPNNIQVHEMLGQVLLSASRPEEASVILGALFARKTLSKDGVLSLAQAYLLSGKPQKAKEVLATIYDETNFDPSIACEYAKVLLEASAYGEARKVLKRVLEQMPGYALAHYYTGVLLRRENDLKKAAESLTKAVQIEPNDTRFRFELARVLVEIGGEDNIREALGHLDKVIQAFLGAQVPAEARNPDVFVLRGQLLFAKQKYPQALKDFEQALAMQPARLDILVGCGRSLFEMARYGEALPYFQQVIAREPMHPDANYYLGRISLRNGQVEKAKVHLEHSIQKDTNRNPEAYRLLGLIYRDQNLIPLARRYLAKYLELAPKDTREAEEVQGILDRMR